MRFVWDAAKERANIARHGVDFSRRSRLLPIHARSIFMMRRTATGASCVGGCWAGWTHASSSCVILIVRAESSASSARVIGGKDATTMKITGKTKLPEAPAFDAEGYQVNLAALNGLPLPDLRRVVTQPLRRGGARRGAGRKPTGRLPILLRLAPATVQALRSTARRQGKTLSDVAESRLAHVMIMDSQFCREFLKNPSNGSMRAHQILNPEEQQKLKYMSLTDQWRYLGEKWKEWRAFKRSSQNKQWCYLYEFTPEICAWGTSSKSSDRVRRAGLFHEKLTGKYDRRVDYLMLKMIYGMPEVWVFEARDMAEKAESDLKCHFGQNHCFRGFPCKNRVEISKYIVRKFKNTAHWKQQSSDTQEKFQEYLEEVFFAKLKHPRTGHSFYYGDSLEPGFLRDIGRSYLEPAIQAMLQIKFYKDDKK